MPEITIDGKPYQVEAGANLLQVCQSLNLQLPYFCWHPSLHSVGSCRQCAILLYQNAEDQRGRITMACMTQVSDGQRLSIAAPAVHNFRKLCIEATMTNHPHDCPVCEEAGECHLQDMTLLSGHISRRYDGAKRTHYNQYLGPFINHEMNRCIACYRCVRFYRNYAGGTDLNVFSSRNNVYFGRASDGVLASEFSGNLVEICPTGVFTDKTYSQHYSRKWDLQSAPSVCVHCSVGCNIFAAERAGTLRRITNRFHPQINRHFLCDRGRFGYDFVNQARRTEQVWWRDDSAMTTGLLDDANAFDKLHSAIQGTAAERVMAIGSSRTSLENNYSLQTLVKTECFYSDMHSSVQQQLNQLLSHYRQIQPSISLQTLEAADCVILIGEDVTECAPLVALALRQMVKNAGIDKAAAMGVAYWSAAEVENIAQDLKSPLHIIGCGGGKLHDIAASTDNTDPDQQRQLLEKIIACLSSSEAVPSDGAEDATSQKASQLAAQLRVAKRPVIVTSVNLALQPSLFSASLHLSAAILKHNAAAGLLCTVPQAIRLGLTLLNEPSHDLDAALAKIDRGEVDTLILLEVDLYRYCAADQLSKLLDKVSTIIVLDHLLTKTAQQADLLLPSCSFAESSGSWVNYEGRLQSSLSCFLASGQRRPAHLWLQQKNDFHSIVQQLSMHLDILQPLASLYQKKSDSFHYARKTVRESGRTALSAYINIKEIPPDNDVDSNYQYSQEGLASHLDKHQSPSYLWSPNWNSNESLRLFQDAADGAIQGASLGIELFANQPRQPGQDSPLYSDQDTIEVTSEIGSNSSNQAGLQLIALHHIYSDEELSGYAASIAQRQVKDCIKISGEQALLLDFVDGQTLAYQWLTPATEVVQQQDTLDRQGCLSLVIDDQLPLGVVMISATIIAKYDFSEGVRVLLSADLGRDEI